VVVDAKGVIYVADAGNQCVRRLAQGQVSTLPTSGGKPEAPTALALDAAGLRVSDSAGGRLWAGPATGPLRPWESGKKSGLSTPAGLATDGAATFVLDAGTHCLYQLDGQATILVVGLQGQPGSADGPGNLARLAVPAGLAARGGTLYVADFGNNSIRKVTVGSLREEVR
jgi:hypothetical protein